MKNENLYAIEKLQQKGVYSGMIARKIYDSIGYAKGKEIACGMDCFKEALEGIGGKKNRGGVILFSTDVNADESFPDKVVQWLRGRVKTVRTAKEEIAWTVGYYLDWQYRGNGKAFGEKSLSIEMIGITSEQLKSIAEDICEAFYQETVLVKDSMEGELYLMNRSRIKTEGNEEESVNESGEDEKSLADMSVEEIMADGIPRKIAIALYESEHDINMTFMSVEEFSESLNRWMKTAMVGEIGEYDVVVFAKEKGYIPHFHIVDRSTLGQRFDTCIEIRQPKYYHHNGKEGVLDGKLKEELMDFFRAPDPDGVFPTSWNALLYEWNKNNRRRKPIPKSLPLPDYTQLK